MIQSIFKTPCGNYLVSYYEPQLGLDHGRILKEVLIVGSFEDLGKFIADILGVDDIWKL